MLCVHRACNATGDWSMDGSMTWRCTKRIILSQNDTTNMQKLEGHPVERIYLRQRASDDSVNKTILKPRLAIAARYMGYVCYLFSIKRQYFPDVKFRVAAQLAGSLGKAAKFRSLYDVGESNPVPASGLWSGSGSKVNQFVHVLTSVDTQHFIQIHAHVFEQYC